MYDLPPRDEVFFLEFDAYFHSPTVVNPLNSWTLDIGKSIPTDFFNTVGGSSASSFAQITFQPNGGGVLVLSGSGSFNVPYNQQNKFQIYCNLQNSDIIINRSGKHYKIKANSYQIWINNNYIVSFDNIPYASPVFDINAFAFSSPKLQILSQYFNISLDNVKYGVFPFQKVIGELINNPTTSFITPIPLASSQTLYAEQFVGNTDITCGGSKGGRQAFTLQIASPPPTPIAAPISALSICEGEIATFTITGVIGSANGVAVYEADGVTLVSASDLMISPPSPASTFQLSFTNVTTHSTYYIRSVYANTPPLLNAGGILLGGCSSSPLCTVQVFVNPIPVISSVSALPICGPGNAVITGTSSIASGSVTQAALYLNATGGSPLVTVAADGLGNFTFSTPFITTNTTFFVEVVSNAGCESYPRTPVPITVHPKPAPPSIPSLALCPILGGVTATFTATPADGFTNQISLYSDPAASLLLQSDNVPPYEFTVSGVLTSTTYYATAENTITGCKSNIQQTRLNILPAPNPPLSRSLSRCGAGVFTVTVTPNNVSGGNLMRLYSVPSGGVPIGQNASPYTIPVSVGVGTSIFYAEAVFAATGCTHLPNNGNNRVLITVTGLVTPLPPTVTPDSIALCNGGQATFSITISPPGHRIRFFNLANAGAPEQVINANSFIFNTPALNSTVVRFLDAVDTLTGCTSPTRVRLKAEVVSRPATPSGVGNFVRCSPGNVEFTLPTIAGATEFRLYQAVNAPNPIGVYSANSGSAIIPNVSVSSTYYLASANAVCESVGRLPIAITIQNGVELQAGDILPFQPICGAGQRTIAINPGAAALLQNNTPKSLRLYATASGGSPIAAQNAAPWQVVTPNISSSTTYYLEIFDLSLGCATSRIPIALAVNPNPAPPILTVPISRCGPGTITGSLLPGANGDNIHWYTALSGGAPLFTGASLTLENVNQTQTLYAASFNSGTGCETIQRLPVTLTVHPIPPQPSAQSAEIKRCGIGTVTLTAALLGGNEIRWYSGAIATPSILDTPTSVTQSVSGHQFTLINIGANASVTAAAVNTATGCISTGRIFNISVFPAVMPPAAETLSVCGNASAALTVNYPFQNNYSLRLYSAQTGGSMIGSASANPYQFNLSVSSNTTYWLSAFEGQNGCESERNPLVINFTPIPAFTNISPVTTDLCNSGSPAFQGALEAGLELRLYTQASGGAPIGVGQGSAANLTAPIITTHTTFFLSIANIAVLPACQSARRSFAFRVNPILPELGNAGGLKVQRCSTGNFSFPLQVTSPQINAVRIYDAPQAGNLIQTLGAPFIFNTGNLSLSTTFYAEAFNTSTGCSSLSRTPIIAQINSSFPPPSILGSAISRCGGGAVTLSILVNDSSQTGIRVYSAASGNNLLQTFSRASSRLTINVSASSTLYIASYSNQDPSCESLRLPIPVTILPPAPTPSWPSQLTYCGDNFLTVPANFGSFTGSTRIALWASPTGGTPLALDNEPPFELSVGSITPGQYWLSSLGEGGCESSRHPVFIRTGTRPSPVNPMTPVTLCGSGNVVIKAQMTSSPGSQVLVYNQPSGGNAILTLSPPLFEAPVNVSSNVTFYLEAITTADCPSSSRTPFVVTVVPTELGRVTGLPTEIGRCGQGGIQFSVNTGSLGAGNVLRLYTAPTLSSAVSEASVAPYILSTPFITTATTFYVGVANSVHNCEGVRTPVVAKIFSAPPLPVAQEVTICANRSVTLTINLESNSGATLALNLYTQTNAQDPVSVVSGSPFTFRTPSISTSTTYWAAASPGKGCESERVPITIQVAEGGALPSFTEEIVNAGCGQNRATIKIIPATAGLWQFRLYTQSSGGTAVATASTAPYQLQTPVISTQTTFYISQLDPVSSCESTRRMVVATQSDAIPAIPIAQNQSFCLREAGASITLTAQMGSVAGREIRVYTAPTGGAPIATLDTPPYRTRLDASVGTTTYYFSAANGDCESRRTPVIASVNVAPPKPTVQINPTCAPGNIAFTVLLDTPSPQGIAVQLYTAEQSASPFLTAPSSPYEFTVNVTTTVTYFVRATQGNSVCVSEMAQVPMIIAPVPPPVVRNVIRNNCGPTDFDIQVSYALGAEALELYTQPTGGAPIKTFAPPTEILKTDVLQTNTTLFLAHRLGACVAPRVAVNLNLQNGPGLTLLSVMRESCFALGSIRVAAAGGSGNYTYRLSNGQSNASGIFENLTPGEYSVFLQDPQFPTCTSKIDNIKVEPFSAATLLTPILIEGENALFQWNPITGAQSFTLGYRKVGARTPYQFSPNLSPNEFQFRFTDLEPETQYEVALFVNCLGGKQIPAANTVFKTLPVAREGFCSIPVNLKIAALTPTSVELRWSPNEGSARCYILMVGSFDTPTQNWQRYSVPHPAYKLLIENLDPNKRYGFAVATNCTECEPSSGIRTPYSPIVIFSTANNNKSSGEVKENLDALSLSLYPNPNNGIFEVVMPNILAAEVTLSVFDLQGKTVWQEQKIANSNFLKETITLENLPAGIYIFEAQSGERRQRVKFIRQW